MDIACVQQGRMQENCDFKEAYYQKEIIEISLTQNEDRMLGEFNTHRGYRLRVARETGK